MIENLAQLEQAREAAIRLEGALKALRDRVRSSNPALFEAMAQDYLASIRIIRNDIDTYLGLSDLELGSAPLWMVLNGERIQGRDISSRLLSEWLGRLRKAVHNVAAYLQAGVVRNLGRPDPVLLDATDLRVLALQPGSIRIGLSPPPAIIQDDLFGSGPREDQSLSSRALDRLLRMALWASSQELDPPLGEFKDRDEAAVVAHQVASLAPTPRGAVQVVAFEGALIPAERPIRMLVDALPRLQGLEKLLSQVSEETVRGVIREIDLDAKRIILRERGPGMSDLKCHLPRELLADAERLLDQQVIVRGLISSATPDSVDVIAIAKAQ